MIFINKKRSEAINIRSVDAAQVYKVNADPEASLYYGKAVISESLFSKWVKQHGTATNNRGRIYKLVYLLMLVTMII